MVGRQPTHGSLFIPPTLFKERNHIMKKIILTIVAMFTLTLANAEDKNMNSTNAYVMNVNMNSLARALQLSYDQADAVKDIHAAFCAEMLNASAADRADRTALTKKAVRNDLKRLAHVLDREQIRKYMSILNATFVNRGISIAE